MSQQYSSGNYDKLIVTGKDFIDENWQLNHGKSTSNQ